MRLTRLAIVAFVALAPLGCAPPRQGGTIDVDQAGVPARARALCAVRPRGSGCEAENADADAGSPR